MREQQSGEGGGVNLQQRKEALVKNPVLHDQSKHIDIKYHFLS